MRNTGNGVFTGRRLFAALTAAITGAALLVPGPAAAADPVSKSFSSDPFKVHHNGKTFKVTVNATANSESEIISVNFTQAKDPSGPAEGTRTVTYSHDTKFSVNDKLSEGNLDPSEKQMGDYGKIDLVWHSTKPLVMSCNDHNRSRKGVFKGDFLFKTGEGVLGNVEKSKLPGTMFGRDNKCPTPFSGNPCPDEGIHLNTFTKDSASVFASKGDGPGRLTAIFNKELGDGWFRSQFMSAAVPASNVTLSDNEKDGVMKGASGTFFSGKSEYSAEFEGVPGEPQPCKGDKESVTQSTSGEMSKGLKADFLIGPDTTVDGTGTAARINVRNAS
jgi:hypothetical protein